jgi:hypothetical protein
MQYKIVTATGDQTLNATTVANDGGIVPAVLVPAPAVLLKDGLGNAVKMKASDGTWNDIQVL